MVFLNRTKRFILLSLSILLLITMANCGGGGGGGNGSSPVVPGTVITTDDLTQIAIDVARGYGCRVPDTSGTYAFTVDTAGNRDLLPNPNGDYKPTIELLDCPGNVNIAVNVINDLQAAAVLARLLKN